VFSVNIDQYLMLLVFGRSVEQTTMTLKSRCFAVLGMATPIFASSIVNVLSSLVGMLMVARLGHLQLAAGALATSTFITLFVMAVTMLYSVGILIGNACGSDDTDRVIRITHSGFFLATIFGVIITAALYFAEDFLTWFGQAPHLVAIASGYFHTIAFGAIPVLWGMVILQFFIGISRPGFNMRFSLVGAPLNILLSYVFIFGKFGLPQMGLAGIGLATTIANWVLLTGIIIYLRYSSSCKKYPILSSKMQIDKTEVKNILKIGLPIGTQFGAELAAISVITYFMGWIGAVALAAQQIISQFTMLIVVVGIGISQAAAVMISQAYAKHDYDSIKQIGKASATLGLIIMSFTALCYILFPKVFIALYLNIHAAKNLPIVALASILFPIAGLLQIIDSARNIFAGALRGLHDSITPMMAGILCLWLLSIPTSYVVGFTFGLGAVGLRIGFVIGFLICALFLAWRFFATVNQLRVSP